MSVIGELLLRIGIDPTSWSQLQSTLDDGKQDVTDFGASVTAVGGVIDSAFSSSVATAATSMQALASATDPVKAAQDELRAAFEQSGVSMDTLEASSAALGAALEDMGLKTADAASGAGAAADNIEKLTPAIEEVSEHAQEAGGAFEGFGENLAQLAEFAGVALTLESLVEVLKDVASESVSAFANLQLISQGMAALTGSSEGAEEVLNQIKGIAESSIFSFPELAQAAQKMAALGISAEQIPGAIQAVANAAEVTGNSLDGVASALDRIYLSGTVSTRGLTQMGISLQDLADAAGISTDQVTTAFKGMGAESSDALDILTYAMSQKVGPAADNMADTLKVAINSVEVEWDSLLEEFGKDLAPGLETLAADVKDVLPYIEQMASFMAQIAATQLATLVGAWQDFASAAKEVWNALAPVASFPASVRDAISQAMPDMVDYLTHIQDIADAAKLAKGVVDLLTGAAQPLQIAATNLLSTNTQLTESVISEQLAHDTAAAAAARHAAALAGLASQAKDTGGSVSSLAQGMSSEFLKLGADLEKMPVDFAAFQAAVANGVNFKGLDTQFQDMINWLNQTGNATSDLGQTMMAALVPAKAQLDAMLHETDTAPLLKGLTDLNTSINLLDKADLSELQNSLNATFKAAAQLGSASLLDPFYNALARLGIAADGTTQKMTTDFANFTTVVNSSQATLAQVDGAWEKIQTDVTKLAKDPGGLEEIVTLTTEYGDKITALGAPLSQQLAAWVSIYNTQLKAAEAEGASSDQILLIGEALDNAKVKQAAFTDATQGMLNLYTNVQNEFGAAWTQFGTGIGDAIAGTESFGQAWKTTLEDMEKKLSELVTNYLLGQLKDAFIQNTNALQDFGSVFNSIFGVGGGSSSTATSAAGGLSSLPVSGIAGGGNTASQDTLGTVATNTSQMSQGITSMTTGIIGTLESVVNMLTGIGQLITGIIQDIEQAHTNTLLDRIELNTRQTATYLGAGGGVIDFLSQILPAVSIMSTAFTGWFHDALASLMTTVEDIDAKTSNAAASSTGSGGTGLSENDLELAVQTAISNSGIVSSGSTASTTSSLTSASDSLSTASSTTADTASTLSDAAVGLTTASGTITAASGTLDAAGNMVFTGTNAVQQSLNYMSQEQTAAAAQAASNTAATATNTTAAEAGTSATYLSITAMQQMASTLAAFNASQSGQPTSPNPETGVVGTSSQTWDAATQQWVSTGQNYAGAEETPITQMGGPLDLISEALTNAMHMAAGPQTQSTAFSQFGAYVPPTTATPLTPAQLLAGLTQTSTVPGAGLTGGGAGSPPITVNMYAPINSAQTGQLLATTMAAQLRSVIKV